MVTKEGIARTVLGEKELVEKVFEAMHGDLGHITRRGYQEW